MFSIFYMANIVHKIVILTVLAISFIMRIFCLKTEDRLHLGIKNKPSLFCSSLGLH